MEFHESLGGKMIKANKTKQINYRFFDGGLHGSSNELFLLIRDTRVLHGCVIHHKIPDHTEYQAEGPSNVEYTRPPSIK